MIIIAVVIGYVLGILPFVIPKIIELIQNKKIKKEDHEEEKRTADILDEYLNGPRIKDQEELAQEYLTGVEKGV